MSHQGAYEERAQFYELEDTSASDHELVRGILAGVRPTATLEIPAGAGRNLELLAECAHRVTLVDREPQMALHLEKRVQNLSLESRVTVRCADIRNLKLGEHFDFIWVPRDSFNLLPPADAVAALDSLVRHLSPGGTLLIDLIGPAAFTPQAGKWPVSKMEVPRNQGRSRKKGEPDWTRSTSTGLKVTRWSNEVCRPEQLERALVYRYGRAGAYRLLRTSLTLYQHKSHDIHAALCAVGVIRMCVYGSYCGRPYSALSERLLILAKSEQSQ